MSTEKKQLTFYATEKRRRELRALFASEGVPMQRLWDAVDEMFGDGKSTDLAKQVWAHIEAKQTEQH